MNNPDPIAVFKTEALEQLELIEAGLLDLTHDLDDKAQIDAVFRGLHTLKGSGSMFGFDQLAAYTHHCETAFDRVRKGEAPATLELVSAVLDAQGHMLALLQTPNGDHEAMSAKLLDNLHRAVGGSAKAATQSAAAEAAAVAQEEAASGLSTWVLTFSLPLNSMINGTNPLGLLDELRELGEARIEALSDTVPPLEEIDPREVHVSWRVTLKTDKPKSDIEDVFIFVMDDMMMDLKQIEAAAAPVKKTPAASAADDHADAAKPSSAAAPDAGKAQQPTDAKAQKQADNVRVPALRLDEMMDRVGELVIAQSRSARWQAPQPISVFVRYRKKSNAWPANCATR